MRLRILKSFRDKLNDQVDYIARDKPASARKFKSDVIKRIKGIPRMPYANRKSIFFDREDIRDLIFKGYVIVYKIDDDKKIIDVFGFTKYEDDPFLK
jgi:plasmid stabilization system protein ParE